MGVKLTKPATRPTIQVRPMMMASLRYKKKFVRGYPPPQVEVIFEVTPLVVSDTRWALYKNKNILTPMTPAKGTAK